MVRWLGVLGLVVVSGCGSEAVDPSRTAVADTDSTEVASSISPTASSIPATPTAPTSERTETTVGPLEGSGELVVERRPPTDKEIDRLDDDGRGAPLDCPEEDAGAGDWEWDEIGPDDPTGRVSDDALRDAIAKTDGRLPESGWTELIFRPGDSTFVHSIANDDWRSIVTVGGDPELGVWRQFNFYACPPIADRSDDPATDETGPAEPLEGSTELPAGSFTAEHGDLIVLRTDGDLEYRPGAVSDDGGAAAIALVDNADPRKQVAEGEGPNVIDDVAGIVNGSIIYGDCCEPVAGNVYALTEPLAPPQKLQYGYSPTLSPDRSTLITGNDYSISAIDTMSRDGIGVQPNPRPNGPYRSVLDLEWIDNETFVVLFYADGLYQLVSFDAATLTEMLPPVEIPSVSDPGNVFLAGRTPTGLIAVEVRDTESTTIRYHDPVSFIEQPDLAQTFPATVSAVEVDADGLGQIWVDGTTLYHLGPDATDAVPLANEVLAAWFVPAP